MGDVLTTAAQPGEAPAAGGDYMAPWIDTDECTECDECIKINSAMFEYNESKKAIIKNPDAGPYSDLVKAAEKCTAEVIHPGVPRNRSESGIDKWMALVLAAYTRQRPRTTRAARQSGSLILRRRC